MLRRTVYLVACTKTKAAGPRAAKDLYTSPWFRKARRYVESRPGCWFILSAEHGLLDPETVIAPYRIRAAHAFVGGVQALGYAVSHEGCWRGLPPPEASG